MTSDDQLTIRRAEAGDLPAVIDVCGEALQWSGDDDDADFFRWKHQANPFGPSPIWVAEDTVDGERRIVGVRAMMLWQFHKPGEPVRRMARAVDTATLPSHQGRGIFSRLTMAAVEELTADGTAAIFNTPNDKSRPGYLKMGWELVGRVPVGVRPRRLLSLPAMAASRVPAERWGIPTEAGVAPAEYFADAARVDDVVAARTGEARWATPLSADYLRWRTSFEPLACRVEPLGAQLEDGFVVFRLRRRGALRQLSILHLVETTSSAPLRKAIGQLIQATRADVALATEGRAGRAAGMVPFPRIGPRLTWRNLADPDTPDIGQLALPLGTIELF